MRPVVWWRNTEVRPLLAATALVIALQPVPNATQVEGNGDGGPATLARLDYPIGIDVDAAGNVFFVEPNTYRIRRVEFLF